MTLITSLASCFCNAEIKSFTQCRQNVKNSLVALIETDGFYNTYQCSFTTLYQRIVENSDSFFRFLNVSSIFHSQLAFRSSYSVATASPFRFICFPSSITPYCIARCTLLSSKVISLVVPLKQQQLKQKNESELLLYKQI